MAIIELTRGAVTVVDDEDYDDLCQWSWCLGSSGYATRGMNVNGRGRAVLMHRYLLGLIHGDGRHGHHLNEDRLDNRRANLRVMLHVEHIRHHTSTGNATFYPRTGRWMARGPRQRYLGYFATEAEARAASLAAQAQDAISRAK
jgi:hypothetical protein